MNAGTSDFADLIVRAGTVHALGGHESQIGAIAVKAGRIIGVGTDDEMACFLGDQTRVLDVGDGTVVPGLIDAHMHPVMAIDLIAGVDLRKAQTPDEARELIAARAATTPAGTWIRGWGLDPNVFGTAEITNSCLNGIKDDRPIFVLLFDAHSGLANDAALQLAGVGGHVDFSDGSRVVCDTSGKPTGLLLEMSAVGMVLGVMPELPFERRKQILLDSLRDMAASGLTGAHCLDMNAPDTLELLTAIERDTDLPLKLRISPWCTPNFCEENLPDLLAVLGRHGRRWKVEGIKLMVDGTIDNGTAWLAEPDANGESTSGLWLDPAQYSASVAYFHAQGVSTSTHAIGDAAVEHVLNTLVALEPSAGTVHRVEHVETIPDELVEPFAAKGIAASMQPTHCTHFTRADQSDNWSRRLGPHRAANGYRTRDLRDAGALLAIGSDWPIADYDPRLIIADAQLRRPALQPDVSPVGPAQRLTALQALEGYTSHAAASVGCNDSGRIGVGARADLTIFSLDPLASDPEDFAVSEVLATIVDGEIVHRDSSVRLGRAELPARSGGL